MQRAPARGGHPDGTRHMPRRGGGADGDGRPPESAAVHENLTQLAKDARMAAHAGRTMPRTRVHRSCASAATPDAPGGPPLPAACGRLGTTRAMVPLHGQAPGPPARHHAAAGALRCDRRCRLAARCRPAAAAGVHGAKPRDRTEVRVDMFVEVRPWFAAIGWGLLGPILPLPRLRDARTGQPAARGRDRGRDRGHERDQPRHPAFAVHPAVLGHRAGSGRAGAARPARQHGDAGHRDHPRARHVRVHGRDRAPYNHRLQVAGADGAAPLPVWQRYLPAWTAWKHVRTVSCALASVLCLLALLARAAAWRLRRRVATRPARPGSSRRCHPARNSPSGASTGTAGVRPRRNRTAAPGA